MIYAFLYLFVEILAFYSAYKALMETRTAQGAIAWTVFLLTFPFLSLPLYWIFGRNRFKGYTSARAVKDEQIHKELSYLRANLKPFEFHSNESYEIDVVKTSIATLPPLIGNDARVLVNGEATFRSITEGLKRAKRYILFEFFIL